MMILSLAESGVFNHPEMTPLQSAFNADLYECLHFLSVKSDLNKEQEERIKQQK